MGGKRDREGKRKTEPASVTTDFAHQCREAQRDDIVEELKILERRSVDVTVMAASLRNFTDIFDEATSERLKGPGPDVRGPDCLQAGEEAKGEG